MSLFNLRSWHWPPLNMYMYAHLTVLHRPELSWTDGVLSSWRVCGTERKNKINQNQLLHTFYNILLPCNRLPLGLRVNYPTLETWGAGDKQPPILCTPYIIRFQNKQDQANNINREGIGHPKREISTASVSSSRNPRVTSAYNVLRPSPQGSGDFLAWGRTMVAMATASGW